MPLNASVNHSGAHDEFLSPQVWFQNRRAKCRKQENQLHKGALTSLKISVKCLKILIFLHLYSLYIYICVCVKYIHIYARWIIYDAQLFMMVIMSRATPNQHNIASRLQTPSMHAFGGKKTNKQTVVSAWLVRADTGVRPRQLETQVTHFLSSQGCSSELRVSLKRAASRHMSTWELCACHSNRQVSSVARALRQIECMEWVLLWHELRPIGKH